MKHFFLMVFLCFAHNLRAIKAHNLHRYMWANYHTFDGNHPDAHSRYQDILQNNGSLYSLQGYAHFLYKENRFEQVAALEQKIDKLFPNDPELQMILALSLKKTGKATQGNERLIKLSQKFHEHPNIVMQAAQAYLQQKEAKNALHIIDDYLDRAPRRGNNFIFHYLKSQIYAHMGDKQNALESVRASLGMHPTFSQGWLLLAAMEEQEGRLQEAIKGYTAFLQMSSQPDKRIEKHLIELVMRQNMVTGDKKILGPNNFSCIEHAMRLLNQRKYPQALEQINKCLQKDAHNPKGQLLKVQILTSMKQYDQALALIAHWIEQDPNDPIWYRVLHITPRAGIPMHKVLATLERIHLKHSECPLVVLYLADMHMRAGNKKQTHIYLKKAEKLVENKDIRAKILFQLGLMDYEHTNYESMKNHLHASHQLDDSFAPTSNLLAYYYATEEHNPQKAVPFIKHALSLDPDNPHFLDTHAVVLYEQGEFQKARKILESIAHENTEDTTIHLHLAQTYRNLGLDSHATHVLKCVKEGACSTQQKEQYIKLLQR